MSLSPVMPWAFLRGSMSYTWQVWCINTSSIHSWLRFHHWIILSYQELTVVKKWILWMIHTPVQSSWSISETSLVELRWELLYGIFIIDIKVESRHLVLELLTQLINICLCLEVRCSISMSVDHSIESRMWLLSILVTILEVLIAQIYIWIHLFLVLNWDIFHSWLFFNLFRMKLLLRWCFCDWLIRIILVRRLFFIIWCIIFQLLAFDLISWWRFARLFYSHLLRFVLLWCHSNLFYILPVLLMSKANRLLLLLLAVLLLLYVGLLALLPNFSIWHVMKAWSAPGSWNFQVTTLIAK